MCKHLMPLLALFLALRLPLLVRQWWVRLFVITLRPNWSQSAAPAGCHQAPYQGLLRPFPPSCGHLQLLLKLARVRQLWRQQRRRLLLLLLQEVPTTPG
jgi:hypothetical protein